MSFWIYKSIPNKDVIVTCYHLFWKKMLWWRYKNDSRHCTIYDDTPYVQRLTKRIRRLLRMISRLRKFSFVSMTAGRFNFPLFPPFCKTRRCFQVGKYSGQLTANTIKFLTENFLNLLNLGANLKVVLLNFLTKMSGSRHLCLLDLVQ